MPPAPGPAPTTNGRWHAAPRLLGRRAVLRAAAVAGPVALLPGCGLLDGDPPGPVVPAPLDPQVPVLREALAGEEGLLRAHRATAARHAGLAPRLAGVLADHEEHRRVLAARLDALDPARPTPPTGEAVGDPPVPDDAAAALVALVALEREAASARTEQAVAGVAGAPLLAVLAASEASHAAVLAP